MLFCVAGLQCDSGKAAQYEGAEVRMQIAPSMVSIGIVKRVLNRLLHSGFCYILLHSGWIVVADCWPASFSSPSLCTAALNLCTQLGITQSNN